jgi:hypothetical protein
MCSITPLSLSGSMSMATWSRCPASTSNEPSSDTPPGHCAVDGDIYNNDAMRQLLILLVLGLLTAGCAPSSRSEVRTNSGGILDCPSDTILYAMFDGGVTGPGEPSPIAAAAKFIDGEWLKDGLPRLENESNGTAAVTIVDWEGNRVGRALVVEHDSGWHVRATESC